ncbi:MAG: TolC family protein [Chitinophagaceae bacterium]
MLTEYLHRSLLLIFLVPSITANAQDSPVKRLTVPELFELAEKNSLQLDVSRKNISISGQQAEIARSAKLPEISAEAEAGFLSNAAVFGPRFNYEETVPVPHLSNTFSVGASETVFKGRAIRNGIEKAELEEQLSVLNFEKDKEDVQLLLLAKYLDLYTLYNQKEVYRQNIELANQRLQNIRHMNQEGMVTRNDIIRSELQISDLTLKAKEVDNDITIINHELCVTLGLPEATRIQVDSSLYTTALAERPLADYMRLADHQNPAVLSSLVNEKIAGKNIQIAKAEKKPVISLYAGNAFQRPFLYSMPPTDIYMNLFQAGVKLQYSISSLYHAKEHIHLAELQQTKVVKQTELIRQQTGLQVHAGFVKYNEAKDRLNTLEESLRLAVDNYRIVEKKYMNQLALLTDILDASTARLGAELNLSNARINIIYRWYQLKKATGNLQQQ